MVVHQRSCACPLCDPQQTKLTAQRERAKAERAARADAPASLAKPVGPLRLRHPESDDTRRLAALLREGKTFAQAAEIIEAEHAQRKDPPP